MRFASLLSRLCAQLAVLVLLPNQSCSRKFDLLCPSQTTGTFDINSSRFTQPAVGLVLTQTKNLEPAVVTHAMLLNANMRLLAPKLASYDCELTTLIKNIEADEQCAAAIIRYANRRSTDPDTNITQVQHAIVFLGLIDVKHFLFSYLLLDVNESQRAHCVQLLIRAKLTSELFKTNGPVNKDLAFVSVFLSYKKLLKIAKAETLFMLFKFDKERKDAIKNLDYGLRNASRQASIIETKCNPKSAKRELMPGEFENMYQDAVYWANGVISAL